MGRSVKKGPFIHAKLEKKIMRLNERDEKKVIKTWSRASMITPDMVGHTIAVYNGRKHVPIFVTVTLVGDRLGEFVPTRMYRGHAADKKAKRR